MYNSFLDTTNVCSPRQNNITNRNIALYTPSIIGRAKVAIPSTIVLSDTIYIQYVKNETMNFFIRLKLIIETILRKGA